MTIARSLSRCQYAPLSSRRASRPLAKALGLEALALKALAFGGVLLLASPSAPAQPMPLPPLSERAVASGAVISVEQGIEFVTVGAPGNAGYAGGLFGNNAGEGAVSEAFRIARTQVTNAQIVEFANAYLPHIQGDPAQQWGILASPFVGYSAATNRYFVVPGAEHYAANMSWRIAARYCNWLCNDRRSDASAFQNGAYDTSTFGNGPNHTFTDQITHNAGARFFLPTRDQWVKASHFDPNRFGPGQGGYWTYPNASDDELRYGFPANGGESIAGLEGIPLFSWMLPVASFASTQSPWGLFDLSGSSRDWNEDTNGFGPFLADSRLFSGSDRRTGGLAGVYDSLAEWGGGASWIDNEIFTGAGLRIAASIPSPTTSVVIVLGIRITFKRERRRKQ